MNTGKPKESPARRARKHHGAREKLAQLDALKEHALQGGGPERVQAQKAKGKLTARERIDYLVDDGSFAELDLLVTSASHDFGLAGKHFPSDGVVTGFARVHGRPVCLFAQDFTVLGGSLGHAHAMKICKIMDLAYDNRVPIIGLLDSGGARIQEGVESLDGYAEIFRRNVKCSGVVPQISAILGPCAGGAVYSPALTDFVFMVEGISHMFVTGPDVVRAATGEEVDFETLGGAHAHATKSGVSHFTAKSESDCFRQIQELISYLPQNRWETPTDFTPLDPVTRETPILETFWGIDPKKAYPIHPVIWQIADEYKFFEVQERFAKNLVIGFIRLGGKIAGVVANNSAYLAGALDIDASDKAARFVRFLNAFNIPILTLVDVPGFWPSAQQERAGIIRHGAKLLSAYVEATVPKVTVILRKAYGGAYIAMGSKHLNGDINLSFPQAELAVMGPRGAVKILFSRELAAARTDTERNELEYRLTMEYAAKFAAPYPTAARGSLDEVIEPRLLRQKVIRALQFLSKKRKPGSHDNLRNIPL